VELIALANELRVVVNYSSGLSYQHKTKVWMAPNLGQR